jgi:hypothetical protein
MPRRSQQGARKKPRGVSGCKRSRRTQQGSHVHLGWRSLFHPTATSVREEMAEFIGFVNAPPDLLAFNWACPSIADRSEVRVSGRAQYPQGMYFVMVVNRAF